MNAQLAEIIAIGDELTSGERVDTNSKWLSQKLGEIGVQVRRHTTVGDDLTDCRSALRQAADRAELVIVTGGLGPTADDLTRQALAAAAGVELVLDSATLESLEELYARRGRAMPEANRVQALFPRGSRIVPNPVGTAPGIDLDVTRSGGGTARVICLPGVPVEMREMWQASVAPPIKAMSACESRVIVHRSIKCYGVGESDLEAMLPDLIRRGRNPQVGITVHQATITLRITAAGTDEAACLASIEPTCAIIREKLGSLVFGEQDEELEHAVARLLEERRVTLATAEWGTSGMVACWLGDLPEAERWFLGGMTIGGTGGLDRAVEIEPSSDPREAVAELAQATRARLAADLGLAVGPFPPQHQRTQQEPGKVLLALAGSEGVRFGAVRLFGHRELHRPRVSKAALNLVRLHLLDLSTGAAAP